MVYKRPGSGPTYGSYVSTSSESKTGVPLVPGVLYVRVSVYVRRPSCLLPRVEMGFLHSGLDTTFHSYDVHPLSGLPEVPLFVTS